MLQTSCSLSSDTAVLELDGSRQEREVLLQRMSEKEEQLQFSWKESAGLKAQLEGMEAELQALKAENNELLQLHGNLV